MVPSGDESDDPHTGDGSTTSCDEIELASAEQDCLHELQLAIEHLYRGYGTLLECHHEVGRAMDRMATAETLLRDAGHESWADDLRDEHLPAGAIGNRWTYEVVDEFSEGFLADVTAFETDVREELADGVHHISEREQQREWRERAAGGSSE
ncbi:hypothetical protein OB919_08705 [Halobacteria archaeon AArc-curdl1]|uniref:Uncharacterized protein n=1 Tax=Natronosalvus hydrolyticus TaxID=2979988 RepID=A0AAP2Z885_9EURY|nr:hypothetical protein [Halobacteria archaeon AArc-curdl1]